MLNELMFFSSREKLPSTLPTSKAQIVQIDDELTQNKNLRKQLRKRDAELHARRKALVMGLPEFERPRRGRPYGWVAKKS